MIDRGVENWAEPRGGPRGLVNVGVKTGAAALEKTLKIITRTANPAQNERLKEAFGALEMAEIETFVRRIPRKDSVGRGRTLVKFSSL